MMIKKINLLLFFVCVTRFAIAQKPSLHPLNSNATLIEYHKNKATKNTQVKINNRTQSVSTKTLSLPFYDEFSYAGPFPDTNKWQNSQSVFINHTKAMSPPTLGVATFDGLNKFGYPYNSAIASNNAPTLPSVASDTLTSAPIRLDSIPNIQSLSPLDSVYLSFYYQGRGFWDKPEQTDYFNLDFYHPKDSSWTQVWSLGGYLYDPDSTWHVVMIPIIDTSYFHNGFKFRFRNLSGGCGDVDHWHLDAVYLNKRHSNDTMFNPASNAFNDVSFVYDLQSPLKNYSQMPFNQYSGLNDMKTNIGTFLRNNYSGLVSVHSNYSFYDAAGTLLNATSCGANNLYPYKDSGYCKNQPIIYPSLNSYAYPQSATNNSFTMKFFIDPVDTIQRNDTITFHQVFNNYYAYDDGSAEIGAGVDLGQNGPGNYKTAARFTLNVADTLRAMDIFFDPIINVDDIKNSPFNILVWADNGGVPGNIMYTDSMRYPYFPADSAVNGLIQRQNSFLRYQFKKPQALAAGTTFYLGINQIYNKPEITIGFDRNTDFHRNMFYNSNGTDWYVYPGDLDVDYRGSLMIRAVLGDSLHSIGVKEFKNSNPSVFTIYPNPATDEVFITSDKAISKIIVTDLLGNIVLQQAANNIQKINTLSLQSGVYLIKAFTDKGFVDTQKLIIAK